MHYHDLPTNINLLWSFTLLCTTVCLRAFFVFFFKLKKNTEFFFYVDGASFRS